MPRFSDEPRYTSQEKPRRRGWRIAAGVVGGILLLAVIGNLINGGTSRDAGTPGAASSAADSAKGAQATVATAPAAPAPVDKSVLQARYDQYVAMPRDAYEPDSYAAIDAALATAATVLQDESATQSAVDAASDAIMKGAGALETLFNPSDYLDPGYEAIARTPDEYVGQSVYIGGSIVQVVEGQGKTMYRVATDYAYDDIVIVTISSDKLDQRFLEGDAVDCYGMYTGIVTYQSTIGASVSVPSISAEKILQQ